MLVGFLNTIPFIASRYIVRTFDNYKRQATARWATHEIIGKKPVREFLGQDIEEISFDMLLRSDLGISPRKEVEKLTKLRDKGTPVPLVIGNKVIGNTFWVVESVSEATQRWSKLGSPLSISVSVTLKEYPDNTKVSLGKAYKGLFS